ncbi:MAG: ankyrin repeat domain-containing protein [Sphingobacteriia bacterium]|nr:ankyrin repeat domain-containing protein [Sphingobacteriia bacterium]
MKTNSALPDEDDFTDITDLLNEGQSQSEKEIEPQVEIFTENFESLELKKEKANISLIENEIDEIIKEIGIFIGEKRTLLNLVDNFYLLESLGTPLKFTKISNNIIHELSYYILSSPLINNLPDAHKYNFFKILENKADLLKLPRKQIEVMLTEMLKKRKNILSRETLTMAASIRLESDSNHIKNKIKEITQKINDLIQISPEEKQQFVESKLKVVKVNLENLLQKYEVKIKEIHYIAAREFQNNLEANKGNGTEFDQISRLKGLFSVSESYGLEIDLTKVKLKIDKPFSIIFRDIDFTKIKLILTPEQEHLYFSSEELIQFYPQYKLYDACLKGDIEAIIQSLDEGAEINKPDGYGNIPLLIAALAEHENAVKILLEKGASLELFTEQTYIALKDLLKKERTLQIENIIDLLADRALINKMNIHLAVLMSDSLARSNKLWDVKEVNSKDFDGYAPLHLAIIYGLEKNVRYLLEIAGADIELSDENGFKPLNLACQYGREDIALYLIEKGADLNCKPYNLFKFTPYKLAKEKKLQQVINKLDDIYSQEIGIFNRLDTLPTEIAFKLFKKFSLKQLVTLRVLNENIKKTIDYYISKQNINLNSASDIYKLIQFADDNNLMDSFNRITANYCIKIPMLRAFPNLKALTLNIETSFYRGAYSQIISFERISELSSLEELTIINSQNLITDFNPIFRLKNKLKKLHLSKCPELENIEKLFELTELIELKIDKINLSAITQIKNLKKLENFELSYCAAIQDLSSLTEIPKLQNLKMTGKVINNLSHIFNISNLKSLSLDNCRFNNLLIGLDKNSNIEELSIQNMNIIPLIHIFKFETFEKLTRLQMKNCTLPARNTEEYKALVITLANMVNEYGLKIVIDEKSQFKKDIDSKIKEFSANDYRFAVGKEKSNCLMM